MVACLRRAPRRRRTHVGVRGRTRLVAAPQRPRARADFDPVRSRRFAWAVAALAEDDGHLAPGAPRMIVGGAIDKAARSTCPPAGSACPLRLLLRLDARASIVSGSCSNLAVAFASGNGGDQAATGHHQQCDFIVEPGLQPFSKPSATARAGSAHGNCSRPGRQTTASSCGTGLVPKATDPQCRASPC